MTWASLFRFEGVTSGSCSFEQPGAISVPPKRCRPTLEVRPAARPSERRQRTGLIVGAHGPLRTLSPLENSIASTSIYVLQATKSQRRMPWRLKPKKDVGGCDKPRGAAYQAVDPWMSEWGNPAPVMGCHSGLNT